MGTDNIAVLEDVTLADRRGSGLFELSINASAFTVTSHEGRG